MIAQRGWLRLSLAGSILLACSLSIPGPVAQEAKPDALQMPEAHFHHLHLNTLDPRAAIDFYTAKVDCEKAQLLDMTDGV